jgi:hypothetical protein
MMIVTVITMEHECIWETVGWGDQQEKGGGKERVLKGEKNQRVKTA